MRSLSASRHGAERAHTRHRPDAEQDAHIGGEHEPNVLKTQRCELIFVLVISLKQDTACTGYVPRSASSILNDGVTDTCVVYTCLRSDLLGVEDALHDAAWMTRWTACGR